MIAAPKPVEVHAHGPFVGIPALLLRPCLNEKFLNIQIVNAKQSVKADICGYPGALLLLPCLNEKFVNICECHGFSFVLLPDAMYTLSDGKSSCSNIKHVGISGTRIDTAHGHTNCSCIGIAGNGNLRQ
jgi:hypothetical protein